MTRNIDWPSREEWVSEAERYARTQCHAWQRVPEAPSAWLTPDELAEGSRLAAAILKATRSALTRAGRGQERPALNADGRDAKRAVEDDDSVNALDGAWRHLIRAARRVDAAPDEAARLDALTRQMRSTRDDAAAQAVEIAVAEAIASRNSDEGWARELERRARVERGPQITTITVYEDGSSTVSDSGPYRESGIRR